MNEEQVNGGLGVSWHAILMTPILWLDAALKGASGFVTENTYTITWNVPLNSD